MTDSGECWGKKGEFVRSERENGVKIGGFRAEMSAEAIIENVPSLEQVNGVGDCLRDDRGNGDAGDGSGYVYDYA